MLLIFLLMNDDDYFYARKSFLLIENGESKMIKENQNPPRDLVGYANQVPDVQFPSPSGKRARVAVQFVINYEEGGEHCLLDGDDRSEWLLSEIVGATPYIGERHMNMESIYEYGSRLGFWRLHRMFSERKMTCTVFAVALAMVKNPQAVQAMKDSQWEIASHGLRWIDYHDMPLAEERRHIAEAVRLHTLATGERPIGIYQGKPSVNTRALVVEEGGFLYDADSYADELPYWVKVNDQSHLVVPYTLDCNDMRFATAQGFNAGDQFFNYLKDTFDFLYQEGKSAPKIMSVGLHCRLVARPGRAQALGRFLDYIQGFTDIWVCQRREIAQYWVQNHPLKG